MILFPIMTGVGITTYFFDGDRDRVCSLPCLPHVHYESPKLEPCRLNLHLSEALLSKQLDGLPDVS